MWGCNNREIVAIKVCCERSASESVPESVEVRNILKLHCIELPGGYDIGRSATQ